MNTDTSKPIGFRPTQPLIPGTDSGVVGWRFWIGPLLVYKRGGNGRVGMGWTR